MELPKDEITQKYAKQCKHWKTNILQSYEYEWRCNSCGYNLMEKKIELSRYQGKKINLINRKKS